jgi:ABC-2 type transport system permease protein
VTKLIAFLKRDWITETSYQFSFFLQIVWAFLSLGSYYFLARFIGNSMGAGSLSAYGGDYFSFVLIGVALSDYQLTSLDAFSRNLRESQLAGTLEALLGTQTSLTAIILYSAAYRFLWTSLWIVIYFILGFWLFDLHLSPKGIIAAALFLILSLLVFSSIGVFSASFIMVFKRGSPISLIFGALTHLVGGVLYPVSILPPWLRWVSDALPITYAIEGSRAALLQGAPWSQLWRSLFPLLIFASILLPFSLVSFHYAARHTRVAGTLGHY